MEDDSQSNVRDAQPRFQFVRELGRGVLGEAHEVLDESTGEPVVLKLFVRTRPKNPDSFKLHFEALARLQNPALVQLHYLIDPKSDTNISLEERIGAAALAFTEAYIEGADLLSYLRTPVTEEEEQTLDERKVQTGEIPSGEIPSGDIPSIELESDEVPREPESEPISADASTSNDFDVSTDELDLSTEDVSVAAGESPDAVLQEFMDERERTTVLDVIFLRLERVVPQITAGLEYLHRFQKVHGSLRPSNILVDSEGNVKLTDYGIVPELVFVGDDESEVPLFQAPENLPFLPPEAFDEGATASGDLYALGCVLFEAISGQTPYDAMEMVDGKLRPPPLADLVKECPASWASIVDALLDPDKTLRPTLRRIAEVVAGDDARPVMLPPSAIPEPENFVGRENIIEGLKHHAESCSDEKQMRLVLLDGETGIGKTQILGALSHFLSRKGWLILRGRCYNRESVAYQGWQEIADQLAELIDDLPAGVLEEIRPYREAVGRILPQLSPTAEPIESSQGRLHAIAGLRKVLARISAQRPILLYLQDLQWASWDTASLLIDLFSHTDGIRCLVIGTWQDDVKRSDGHLLHRDLDLALLDLTRIRIRGYSHEEAQEFARLSSLQINPMHISSLLQQKWINPLLLRELRHEHENIDDAIGELVADIGDQKPNSRKMLKQVFKKRLRGLGRRDTTLLNLLAVASGPLPMDILHEAAEDELASVVLPQEGTERAIDEALDALKASRLVRMLDDDLVSLSQEVLREQLLDDLADRDHARLAGRIADAYGVKVPNRHDLRFEYALRAGRVATAIESAVDAATDAEERYAYHRAAKLWRWLLEHQDQLPEYSMIRPASELARVEHLAGQHADAAELYSQWAEEDAKGRPQIRLLEAKAWLQAGNAPKAVVALSNALESIGERYRCTTLDRIGDWPTRFLTASSRWSSNGGDMPSADPVDEAIDLQADLFYFAADANNWLDSSCGAHFEAKLARLGEKHGSAMVLGMSRLKTAEYQSIAGDMGSRDRCLEWVEDAHRFFEICEDSDWAAQTWLHEGIVRYRFGEYPEAYQAFKNAIERSAQAETAEAFDARRNYHWLAWSAVRTGRIGEAMEVARRIIHIYRGDRLAGLLAYEVMAQVELLRGNLDRAEQFLDAADESMTWFGQNAAFGSLAHMRAQLHIARGRPEVAVGQLELSMEKMHDHHDPNSAISANVALGQALAAQADRERALQEDSFRQSMVRLKNIRKVLSRAIRSMSPHLASEVYRLFACVEMLREAPRRALREAERAIEVVSDVSDPVTVAKCTEARGRLLLQMERPEAKTCLDQAKDMYAQVGASYPLVLEGWPVTDDHSTLKAD